MNSIELPGPGGPAQWRVLPVRAVPGPRRGQEGRPLAPIDLDSSMDMRIESGPDQWTCTSIDQFNFKNRSTEQLFSGSKRARGCRRLQMVGRGPRIPSGGGASPPSGRPTFSHEDGERRASPPPVVGGGRRRRRGIGVRPRPQRAAEAAAPARSGTTTPAAPSSSWGGAGRQTAEEAAAAAAVAGTS